MAKATETTALAVTAEYAILDAEGGNTLNEIMETNLGDDAGALTQFDLDKIGMPTGGMGRFGIPTLDEPDYEAEFQGVIVAQKKNRAYWSDPTPKSGQLPDCYSDDGVTGHGDPGGACAICPLAEFGSHSKGIGQACKLTNPLFIVRPEDVLPVMLNVPPSSLRAYQKYRLDLTKRKLRYTEVVTRFSLEKATNKGGIDYHTIKFSVVEPVPAEHRPAFSAYGSTVDNMLKRTPASAINHAASAAVTDDFPEDDADEVAF